MAQYGPIPPYTTHTSTIPYPTITHPDPSLPGTTRAPPRRFRTEYRYTLQQCTAPSGPWGSVRENPLNSVEQPGHPPGACFTLIWLVGAPDSPNWPSALNPGGKTPRMGQGRYGPI